MPDEAGTRAANIEGVTVLMIALPHGGLVTVQYNPQYNPCLLIDLTLTLTLTLALTLTLTLTLNITLVYLSSTHSFVVLC